MKKDEGVTRERKHDNNHYNTDVFKWGSVKWKTTAFIFKLFVQQFRVIRSKPSTLEE